MHVRILHMFSGLQDTGHTFKMDSLFNLVNLACKVFALPAKVKMDGVIQRSHRDVPSIVIQEELKGKRTDTVRGMLKVVVLQGDSKSRDLVFVSNYDQKPFYMISHSISTVTWVVKEKKVWSTQQRKNVVFKFL